jgi:serine/threonine protein kinase
MNLSSDAYVESYQGRGTPAYRAPELVRGGKYCRRSDSWSIGCILFRVATTNNRSAFKGDGDVLSFALDTKIPVPKLAATDNLRLQQLTECPISHQQVTLWEQINAILELCFTREPEQRATAFQLKDRFEKIWSALPENARTTECPK